MGREFLDDALAIDIAREGVRVTGFAGLPTLHRPDPGQQFLFVNGRPVKDRLLIGAVRAAYGDLVPKGRYPLLALFVALPPREVDVNVHPSKAEVRFRDAGAVRSLVAGALRAALEAAGHKASTAGGLQAISALARSTGVRLGGEFQSWPRARLHSRDTATPAARRDAEACRGLAGADRGTGCAERRAAPRPPNRSRPNCSTARLGAARAQLHETYIVAQTRTSVVIVDQHAAHERLVYERIKGAMANGGVARQVLLIPEIVELDADEAAALAEAAGALEKLGPRRWRRSAPAP